MGETCCTKRLERNTGGSCSRGGALYRLWIMEGGAPCDLGEVRPPITWGDKDQGSQGGVTRAYARVTQIESLRSIVCDLVGHGSDAEW